VRIPVQRIEPGGRPRPPGRPQHAASLRPRRLALGGRGCARVQFRVQHGEILTSGRRGREARGQQPGGLQPAVQKRLQGNLVANQAARRGLLQAAGVHVAAAGEPGVGEDQRGQHQNRK
jgi:hypothetical protein